MNVENSHLVAIDAAAADARLIVVRPPLDLDKEPALAFAAHLIATANTALASTGQKPAAPLDFARATKQAVERRKGGPMGSVMTDAASGKVVFVKAFTSLEAHQAIALAAEIVAAADPDANMLERVEAVVAAARGGASLEATLKKHGHEVRLGAPMRSRLEAFAETAPQAEAIEERSEEESAVRRMKR